jgi:hypothetical protein
MPREIWQSPKDKKMCNCIYTRYLEVAKSHRQYIEWWLPEVGGMESYGLMDTEFQYYKIKKSSGSDCIIMLTFIILLKCIIKILNFLCVFYSILKVTQKITWSHNHIIWRVYFIVLGDSQCIQAFKRMYSIFSRENQDFVNLTHTQTSCIHHYLLLLISEDESFLFFKVNSYISIFQFNPYYLQNLALIIITSTILNFVIPYNKSLRS